MEAGAVAARAQAYDVPFYAVRVVTESRNPVRHGYDIPGAVTVTGGLLAQVTCSFNSALHRQALIVGSTGVIQTTYPNHTSAERPGILNLRKGIDAKAVDSIIETAPADGFLAEAESFARLVRENPDSDLRLEAIFREAEAHARSRCAIWAVIGPGS